eukprot:SAG11_NODE_8036_length_1066_cov_1.511892_1_plen_44_part_10
MAVAAQVGIGTFVTGGIGGVVRAAISHICLRTTRLSHCDSTWCT